MEAEKSALEFDLDGFSVDGFIEADNAVDDLVGAWLEEETASWAHWFVCTRELTVAGDSLSFPHFSKAAPSCSTFRSQYLTLRVSLFSLSLSPLYANIYIYL